MADQRWTRLPEFDKNARIQIYMYHKEKKIIEPFKINKAQQLTKRNNKNFLFIVFFIVRANFFILFFG